MIRVTKSSFPNVCAAFRTIEEDNGGHLIGTVYPGKRLNLEAFEVPDGWSGLLPPAEAGLALLRGKSREDFETFVCGEMGEADLIRDRQGNLAEAQKVLADFFDGW